MLSEPRRRVAMAPGIVGAILVMMILLLIPAGAGAGQATLSWLPNTEPDLAGYKVYFGQASRIYQAPVDVGNSIGYTLTGLPEGVVYYFAVTAYNSGGESAFSSEVSMLVRDTTPPVISAIAVIGTTASSATFCWRKARLKRPSITIREPLGKTLTSSRSKNFW